MVVSIVLLTAYKEIVSFGDIFNAYLVLSLTLPKS